MCKPIRWNEKNSKLTSPIKYVLPIFHAVCTNDAPVTSIFEMPPPIRDIKSWKVNGEGERRGGERRRREGKGSGREEINDMVWLVTEQKVAVFKCCQINEMSNCLKSTYSAPSPSLTENSESELWEFEIVSERFWNAFPSVLFQIWWYVWWLIRGIKMEHHITNKWKWIVERNNFDKWLICFIFLNPIFVSHLYVLIW